MAITSSIQISGNVGGLGFNAQVTRSAESPIGLSTTLAAAKSGSLTTRTNNTDGTLTMGAGHGITTGATIDLYWSGGKRTGVTVGTVSGNSVPISAGTGDNLPAQDTAVTAMVHVVGDVAFEGDNLVMLAMLCSRRACVTFYSGGEPELAVELQAGEPWCWFAGSDVSNVLAGTDIDEIRLTQADASADGELVIAGLYDSVA